MQGEWPIGVGRWSGLADLTAQGRRVAGNVAARLRIAGRHGVALMAALVLDPGFLSIGEPTRRLLCGALAALWLLWTLGEEELRSASPRRWIEVAAASAGVALLFFAPMGACGAALGATLLLAARGREASIQRTAIAVAWAIASLALWRLLLDFGGVGWQLNAAAAGLWSRLLGALGGTRVRFGGDFAGAPLIVAFTASALGAALATERSCDLIDRRRLLLLAGQIAIVIAVAAATSALLLRLRPESPAPGDIGAWHLSLFAALSITLLFAPRTAHRTPPTAPSAKRQAPSAKRRLTGAPCLVIGICALLCLGLWTRREAPLGGKRVGLCLESMTPWQTSASSGYGGTCSATLGDCADLLAALGCRVRHLKGALAPEALSTLDVLVVPTPARAFTVAEQRAVEQFVRNGGGLMALAEHTDLSGNRRHLMPLLRPFGIAVNNDSALAVAGESWREAIAVRPHPILPTATTSDRHGVAIGASLTVTPPARPLLVGRGLFADPATPQGELGDLRYERPERIGDVVVAATSLAGKGRVLVFGDPSPLMNYPLHSTDAMIRRAFAWLTGGSSGFETPLLLGVLLCAALTLPFSRGQSRRGRMLIALLAAPLAQALLPTPAQADRVPYPTGTAALIDNSHREALTTHDAFTSSTAGLARGLRRAGYLPSRLERFDKDAVARAGALLLLSPTRDLSEGEERSIDAMLAGGGTLLLALGWSEQPPLPRLMRYLHVRVQPTPLGPVTAHTAVGEAHFPAAWALQAEDGSYQVVCSRWGYPILLEGHRGRGRILVIGDPALLLGDNMEGMEQFDVGNIALFQHLLSRPESTEVTR